MRELRPVLEAAQTGSPEAVRRASLAMVRALLDDRAEVFATRHVLGFLHARLGDVDEHVIRLHLWPRSKLSPAQPDWPIHTHLWRIDSQVLCGRVGNYRYAVAEDKSGPHRLYEVRYDGANSKRVGTERLVNCDLLGVDWWTAGQSYSIATGEFHTTRVDDGVFAATLIITGQPTLAPPLVLGDRDGALEYEYSREVIPDAAFVSWLRELESRLGE